MIWPPGGTVGRVMSVGSARRLLARQNEARGRNRSARPGTNGVPTCPTRREGGMPTGRTQGRNRARCAVRTVSGTAHVGVTDLLRRSRRAVVNPASESCSKRASTITMIPPALAAGGPRRPGLDARAAPGDHDDGVAASAIRVVAVDEPPGAVLEARGRLTVDREMNRLGQLERLRRHQPSTRSGPAGCGPDESVWPGRIGCGTIEDHRSPVRSEPFPAIPGEKRRWDARPGRQGGSAMSSFLAPDLERHRFRPSKMTRRHRFRAHPIPISSPTDFGPGGRADFVT